MNAIVRLIEESTVGANGSDVMAAAPSHRCTTVRQEALGDSDWFC